MPQLNPDPWFLYLLTSWTILILFSMTKILNFTQENIPILKEGLKKCNFLAWPWH